MSTPEFSERRIRRIVSDWTQLRKLALEEDEAAIQLLVTLGLWGAKTLHALPPQKLLPHAHHRSQWPVAVRAYEDPGWIVKHLSQVELAKALHFLHRPEGRAIDNNPVAELAKELISHVWEISIWYKQTRAWYTPDTIGDKKEPACNMEVPSHLLPFPDYAKDAALLPDLSKDSGVIWQWWPCVKAEFDLRLADPAQSKRLRKMFPRSKGVSVGEWRDDILKRLRPKLKSLVAK